MSRKMQLFLLLAAIALLAFVILAYRNQGLGQVTFVSSGSNDRGTLNIGVRGPFTLKFPEGMLHEGVEQRLTFEPSLKGFFTWEEGTDRMVSFWPAQLLQAGQRITVRLAAGARSTKGRTAQEAQTWQVEVRRPEILFLSPSAAPELWIVSSDGQNRTQLTHTGGGMYDYGVSFYGNLIAYAVRNEQQGYDLWEMGRQGEPARRILPCGADWCTTPTYSPDGSSIAYSRRKVSGLPGRQPEAPRIWTVNRASQTPTTAELFADPHINGSHTYWSPDGRSLAFYDAGSGGVRVYNPATKTSSFFPAADGTGIEWFPDSTALLYLEAGIAGEQPYNRVIQLDAGTWDARPLFAQATGTEDYSVPALSTDGEWMAAGQRLAGGSMTRQLWLFPAGEAKSASTSQAITADVLYTHGGYQWEPGGSRLVFQRLAYGKSDSLPQVVIWNRLDRQALLLSEDAFQPLWIP